METSTDQGSTSAAEAARMAFDAISRRDLETLQQAWDADSQDDFLPIGSFRGREAIAAFFRELFAAIPDFAIEPERILEDGPVAVVQWRAHGTFDGASFQGIEPTGRRVELRGVDVMEWQDGMLRHNTIYYDGADFARQIGLLPPKDSAADKGMLAAFNAATKLRSRLRGSTPPR